MILLQAVVVGALGFCLGMAMTCAFFESTKDNLDLRGFYMPLPVMAGTGVTVFVIIILASLVSIRRVLVLEPAVVFRG
jgi:putative ABC transport system permease protein